MISQFVYISTALNLTHAQVEEILDTCRRKNVDLGVTGLLLYNGRNFLQFLEGERAALEALMKSIEKDDRHSGVTTLHNGEREARDCPDWAMRRIAILDDVRARKDRLEEELPARLDPAIRQMILNFAVLN